jgi:hypothetical protein
VVLTNPNGLVNEGIDQMPEEGPFITDADYTVSVEGQSVTGAEIIAALKQWLSTGFAK